MFEVNGKNPPNDYTDCGFVYRSVYRKARGTSGQGERVKVRSGVSTRDARPDRKPNLLP